MQPAFVSVQELARRATPATMKNPALCPNNDTAPPLGSMFHQQWWLNAASVGRFGEVVVSRGDSIVGRLPYFIRKRLGFTQLTMPPFTHLLGPAVDPGAGKPQTQLLRRISIIRTLIDQLPPYDSFKQVLGEANVDALAFQDRGFQVSPQYTFEIDCRNDPKEIWAAMHFKTRQHIRRAEEKLRVGTIDDPEEFVRFYSDNLRQRSRGSFLPLEAFPALFAASRARDSGEILAARWPGGKPAAMAFLVWDGGKMYYLLSTHARDQGDNGSVNLLIWSAINRAHSRCLVFDLDGVSTSGTARFLSVFGGEPKVRMLVQRSRFAYSVVLQGRIQFSRAPADNLSAFT